MKYTTLKLSGQVFNRPDHKIQTSYSWPLGVDWNVVSDKLIRFRRAFDWVSYDAK